MIPFSCWSLLSLVDFVDLSCGRSNIQTRGTWLYQICCGCGFADLSFFLSAWLARVIYVMSILLHTHQCMCMRKVTGAGRIGAQLTWLLQSTQLKHGQE